MWEMGIQGKLWRVIRKIYNVNQSCVYLDGIKSEYRKSGKFHVENFLCCIFSRGEIFIIHCIDEIFTLS